MHQFASLLRSLAVVSNRQGLYTTSSYIYFNFSTCFAQLYTHHQEKLLYLRDTGIFPSVWVAVWSAGWDKHSRQLPIQNEKYQCSIDTVSSPDDGHIVARNM